MNNEAITTANAGIYALICTATGQKYVGCSRNVRQRIYNHFSDMKRKKHHSRLVQELYDTHGRDSFDWEVLEVISDRDQRKAAEATYIQSGLYDLNLLSSPLHESNYDRGARFRFGERNPRFLGFYTVPWGCFPSSSQAENESNGLMSSSAVHTHCMNSDRVISRLSYVQSPFLKSVGESVIGKTWRDLGFGFEPASPKKLEQ